MQNLIATDSFIHGIKKPEAGCWVSHADQVLRVIIKSLDDYITTSDIVILGL